MSHVQIINGCTHFVILPPQPSCPNGFRLVPGANTVPQAYVRELESFTVPEYGEGGGFMKVKLFDSLGKPSPTSGGKAQVVVLGECAEDAPEGPPPPQDLAEYKEEIALKLVEVTADKAALRRWSKDKRGAVAAAAKAKV